MYFGQICHVPDTRNDVAGMVRLTAELRRTVCVDDVATLNLAPRQSLTVPEWHDNLQDLAIAGNAGHLQAVASCKIKPKNATNGCPIFKISWGETPRLPCRHD